MKYLLILCLLLCGCEVKRDWTILKEGEVERVEYKEGIGWGAANKTIIYFEDGTSYVLMGYHDVPSNYVKIYKNQYTSRWERKVE